MIIKMHTNYLILCIGNYKIITIRNWFCFRSVDDCCFHPLRQEVNLPSLAPAV